MSLTLISYRPFKRADESIASGVGRINDQAGDERSALIPAVGVNSTKPSGNSFHISTVR